MSLSRIAIIMGVLLPKAAEHNAWHLNVSVVFLTTPVIAHLIPPYSSSKYINNFIHVLSASFRCLSLAITLLHIVLSVHAMGETKI